MYFQLFVQDLGIAVLKDNLSLLLPGLLGVVVLILVLFTDQVLIVVILNVFRINFRRFTFISIILDYFWGIFEYNLIFCFFYLLLLLELLCLQTVNCIKNIFIKALRLLPLLLGGGLLSELWLRIFLQILYFLFVNCELWSIFRHLVYIFVLIYLCF